MTATWSLVWLMFGSGVCLGTALGIGLKVAIDYAELAAYRRVARHQPEGTKT